MSPWEHDESYLGRSRLTMRAYIDDGGDCAWLGLSLIRNPYWNISCVCESCRVKCFGIGVWVDVEAPSATDDSSPLVAGPQRNICAILNCIGILRSRI